jgi:hypothetical protein
MRPWGISFLLAASTLGLATIESHAQVRLTQVENRRALQIFASGDWVRLKNELDLSVSGPGGSVGLLFALNEKWGLGASAQQTFSASAGFASIYTGIEMQIAYAWMGALDVNEVETKLNQESVVTSFGTAQPAGTFHVFANQYFLNSSTRVVGLSGIGVGVSYLQPIAGPWAILAMAKLAIASNGSLTIRPLQFSTGLSLRL